MQEDGTAITADFAAPFNGGAGMTTSRNMQIIQSVSLVNENAYVKVSYTVTNNDASPHKISIVPNCDVQIGGNDSAPITPTGTGALMSEGNNGAQFNVIAKNAYGVTD